MLVVISPDRIAALNWALGCALAGVAGILLAPIVSLQIAVMTNVVLAAMAAALVAGFRSFPIALAGEDYFEREEKKIVEVRFDA